VNNGVFYYSNLNVRSFIFDNELLKEPLCIEHKGEAVVAGFWNGKLLQFNNSNEQPQIIYNDKNYISNILDRLGYGTEVVIGKKKSAVNRIIVFYHAHLLSHDSILQLQMALELNAGSICFWFTSELPLPYELKDWFLCIPVPGQELTRVLGGGIVPGSLVLFGGEPGIGKSTLMLQLALRLKNLKVLYVSGEESEQQIKMRAERIGVTTENCFILQETNTQNIFTQINSVQPQLVVIDSIQTIHTAYIDSSPGSVSQVRECAAEFLRFAKETNVPVFMIGHITKEGSLAGPKVLEHMVDTVLQFEGDRNHIYRLLRATKNRFGSTNEMGIYEMNGDGLKEVLNPSEILITDRNEATSGVAIAATLEGNRPLLIETQALVSTAAYGTPQRSSTGFDLRRLSMLLAVLEKRCGFRLGAKDVFINIAGGIKVEDPGIDLALVCAVL
jgi:hypothetical protein